MAARHRVASGSPYEAAIGFSRAVRVGDRVVIAGALAEAGASLADVVRTRMFIVSSSDAAVVGAVHGELFSATRPAATMVVVAGLLDPRWKVEVEAEALVNPWPGGGRCP